MIDMRQLRMILLILIAVALAVLSINAQGRDTGVGGCFIEKNGRKQVVPCPSSAPPSGGNTTTGDNGEAARKAEADKKAAEDKAEADRLAKEAKDKKDAADRQAAFKKAQDEAVKTLKDSGGATMIRNGDTGDTGLRDNRPTGTLRDGSSAVDTRPVKPSDPRPYEKAIAGAFSKSSSDVTERIRKGFQAVETKDWKVAKAWFQDALNHEPNNIGIIRLVAFCDYSLTLPAPAVTKPVAATPNPTMSETDREAYLKILTSAEDKYFQDEFERGMNDFYLNYVPKHPELQIKVIKTAPTVKPAPSTLDLWLKQLQKFLSPPPKNLKVTAVIAVRG